MEVISQKKNPLMSREEAWVCLEHAGKPTPPRAEIIAEAAKHFKAKEDCVIIDKIFSETGKAASRVKVLVYPKAEAVPKDKMEKMKIRMGLVKKGDAEAAPAQAPAAPGGGKPEEKNEEPGEAKPEKGGRPAEEKKEESKKGEAEGKKDDSKGAEAKQEKPEEKKDG